MDCSFSKDIDYSHSYENWFAHTVAVIKLHLSKKNYTLLIFTFFKPFVLILYILIIFYYYICFIV